MADAHADPRAATATIVGGPPELLGPSVIVDLAEIDGREILLPRTLPGVAEYVTVARSEAEADALRPRLAEGLDEKGSAPYQPDGTLVFDFHAAAGTVVTEAIAGLEAFANHRLGNVFDRDGALVYTGRTYSLREAREIPLNERIGYALPDALGMPRPTAERWWNTFRRIQGLAALKRHGVTDAVGRSGLDGERTLVQRLVAREYRGAARMMLAAFEALAPRWIPPERMEKLPAPPPE